MVRLHDFVCDRDPYRDLHVSLDAFLGVPHRSSVVVLHTMMYITLYGEPETLLGRAIKRTMKYLIRRTERRNKKLKQQIVEEKRDLVKILHIDPVYRLRELWIEDLESRLKAGQKQLTDMQVFYVNTFICPFRRGK